MTLEGGFTLQRSLPRRVAGGNTLVRAQKYLTPKEVCRLFSKGVGRPVRYVHGPIEVKVRIPEGYREQLVALEQLYDPNRRDPRKQPPYFGDPKVEISCPSEALELWEGPRGIEEYAREMFPIEEEANGLTWMLEDDSSDDEEVQHAAHSVEQLRIHEGDDDDDNSDDENDDGLVIKGRKRDEEEWLA
jgi:hypothetical protein